MLRLTRIENWPRPENLTRAGKMPLNHSVFLLVMSLHLRERERIAHGHARCLVGVLP